MEALISFLKGIPYPAYQYKGRSSKKAHPSPFFWGDFTREIDINRDCYINFIGLISG
jgi:hypothetical protein